jgi:hypothetical protein
MYRFTRGCGIAIAGTGWAILVGAVGLATIIALTGMMLPPDAVPRNVNPLLFLVGAIFAGWIVGLLLGGPLIIAGQLLCIAVDSVNIQAAMLEQLRAQAERRPGGRGGRFSELAGE